MWNLAERDAVERLLCTPGIVRSALEAFCRERARVRHKDCAQAMRSVPRQYELASDYAAKAEVYDELLSELDSECMKSFSGPTEE